MSRFRLIAAAAVAAGAAGASIASAQPVGPASQPVVVLRPSSDAGPLVIACDGLPPAAVRTVPSPLDQYVTLICTRSGQALKPVDGYQWVFDQGVEWLTATNPEAPSKDDHYTALAYKPLSPDELGALRAELAKLQPDPEVLTRPILRFSVTTSWGARKELYILPPADGAAGKHALGMECLHGCRPIDTDPWFFAIVPTG